MSRLEEVENMSALKRPSFYTVENGLRSKKPPRGRVIWFLLSFLMIMLICIRISVGILMWFYSLQKQYVGIHDNLLLIHSSYSTNVIIFSVILIGLLMQFRIFNGKYLSDFGLKIRYSTLAIGIAVIAFISLSYSFFDYSVINENGIYQNATLFSATKNYSWSNIEQASVEYYYVYKGRIGVKYILSMNDGYELNLTNSEDFWFKILPLEDVLKQKGVRIERMPVNSKAYRDLKRAFSGPAHARHNTFRDVIVKLFEMN